MNAYNCLCIGHILRYMAEHDGATPASVTDARAGKTDVWDLEVSREHGALGARKDRT